MGADDERPCEYAVLSAASVDDWSAEWGEGWRGEDGMKGRYETKTHTNYEVQGRKSHATRMDRARASIATQNLDLERVGRVENKAGQHDPQIERRRLLQLREERRVLRTRKAGAVNKHEHLEQKLRVENK